MDKSLIEDFKFCEETPFIYSNHGICGDKALTLQYKNKLFPELQLTKPELKTAISDIKKVLVKDSRLNEKAFGKERCYIAILYWLSTMTVGDIVFVRTHLNEVFLCRVTDYISESFFDRYGRFQRPVQVLQKLSKTMISEGLWQRTAGRKTIERNAKKAINELVRKHLRKYNLE